MTVAGVVAVALLGALCSGHGAPENACALRGSLEVFSSPDRLPVTTAHCDLLYEMQDFIQTPSIRYLAAKPGESYTLIVLDPDQPGYHPGIFVLHWLIANIPGEDFRYGNLGTSTEVASYLYPKPPDGSGIHRYMFYVYLQRPHSARLTAVLGQPDRLNFKLEYYMKDAHQQGVLLEGPLVGVQFRLKAKPLS